MKIGDYEIHPAAKLFPMMGSDELKELVGSISKIGLIHPIILFKEQILDGRNRLIACGMADVKPRFEYWCESGSPTEYILSLNLHRRHLTASQKAAIATEALPMFEAEAKERIRKAQEIRHGVSKEIVPELSKGQARDKAAAVAKVNPRYVSDAKAIKEKSPETFERVKSGEITIPQAKKQIWDAGAIGTRPEEHDPEDDDSDWLWQLKQCWRKATKKEKAEFLKWVEENGSKSKRK